MLRASTRPRSSSASRRARGELHPEHDECDGLRDGDGRKDIGGDLHPGHRSSIGCWSREAAGALLREPFRPRERPRSCPRAVAALDAAAADGGRARRRLWVMLFDPDGSGNRALKQPHPIDQSDYRVRHLDRADRRRPPSTTGRPEGRVSGADRSAQWDLRITPGVAAPVKLLTDRGYKAKFPTAKTMVRHPLARFDGQRRTRRHPLRGRTAGPAASTTTGADGTRPPTRSDRCADSTARPSRAWRS